MRFNEVEIGAALTMKKEQSLARRSILRKVGPQLVADDQGNRFVVDGQEEVLPLHTAAVSHAVWLEQGGEWRLVVRWTTPTEEEVRWASLGAPTSDDALISSESLLGELSAANDLASDADKAVEARRSRGLLAAGLHARGDLEEAILIYDELVDEREEPSLLNNRGAARAAAADLGGAIRDYSRAIALDGGMAQAYSNRGNAYTKLGRHELALEDYNQALDLAGHMAPIYCNRGLTRKLLGDLTGSLEDFDLSITIDETFAPGYLARGGVRALVGDLPGAIGDLEEFLALSPKAPQAPQVRSALRRLRGALEQA